MKKKFLKYLILFIIILVWNLIVMEVSGDEVWCFGFSYNISRGLIPYKDFNCVIPPLFSFIMSIPMFFFGTNILVFHITWAIFATIILYFIFKLLKEKGWLVFLSFFFLFPIIAPNYNMLIYFIMILVIWAEKENKSDYLIGFLLALTVLTKHTVGLFLILPSLVYMKTPKKILKRCITFIIPIIIFIIYLFINNAFYSFIDLCILGLFDFASSNGHLLNIYVFCTVIVLILTIFMIIKDKKNISNYYALVFASIVFPIFDLYHFWVFFSFFIFIYLLNHNINLKLNIKLFTFGLILFISFLYLQNRLNQKIIYPNHINKFEYRFIGYNEIIYTNKVLDIIHQNKNKRVIDLNSNNYYFKLITDQDIDKLDLINQGNWGYHGSNKLLKEIKKNKDIIYLIDKRDLLYKENQLDKNVLKYIIKNGKKIGSIKQNYLGCDIYTLDK